MEVKYQIYVCVLCIYVNTQTEICILSKCMFAFQLSGNISWLIPCFNEIWQWLNQTCDSHPSSHSSSLFTVPYPVSNFFLGMSLFIVWCAFVPLYSEIRLPSITLFSVLDPKESFGGKQIANSFHPINFTLDLYLLNKVVWLLSTWLSWINLIYFFSL